MTKVDLKNAMSHIKHMRMVVSRQEKEIKKILSTLDYMESEIYQMAKEAGITLAP